jgi:hypothetical protein
MKDTDYTDYPKRPESTECKFVQSVSAGCHIESGYAAKALAPYL